MRIEQRGQMAAMQQLESKSDEELEAETRYKAAAQAILGYRAAERYDAKEARAHFQKALAAARGPQERAGIRKMADASLALAERRADDLKRATERLGVEAPTTRQLRSLRFLGLIAPPASAGRARPHPRDPDRDRPGRRDPRPRRSGSSTGSAQIFGGMSVDLSVFWGFVLVAIVVGGAGRLRATTSEARPGRSARNRSPRDRADAPPCAGATRWPRRIRLRFERASRSASRSRSGRRYNVAPGRRGAGRDHRPGRQSSRRAAAVGTGPVLGQAARHRPQDDQRPGRDGRASGRRTDAPSSATAA